MEVQVVSSHDGLWSIGELAEWAGTTVKTVRFYSDRGLLPEAGRSSGGYRRYGTAALDRLRLIRSLRALDLPVSEVHRIVEDEDISGPVLEAAVADRLSELGTEISALRWREAGLKLLAERAPQERAEVLQLVGGVTSPPTTDSLARFWRAWLPLRMPAGAVSAFLAAAVPQPPAEPAPGQLLAFAQLHSFVTRPCPGDTGPCQPAAHQFSPDFRPEVLYDGLAEAYELAAAPLRRSRPPRAGEALDCFVTASAASYGAPDTPGFRGLLAARLAADPRIDGYWELVAKVNTPQGARPDPTPGTAHEWLVSALSSVSMADAAAS
ncbi:MULTISPECIES: MerR family transcriptional regulator [unclassified Streptomyces]|uniref:MerR family transcriptional regulator n=1 Tax=unclassified Streptomyces TaxID=2593676 RepID=UPI00324348C1